MTNSHRSLALLVALTLAAAPATKLADPAVETRALAYEIAQRKDPDRRAAGIAHAVALLDAGDVRGQLIAINAIRSVGDVKFDRAAIADALRRAMHGANDEVRAAALAALPSNGGGPRDLDAIIALANDPSPRVRAAVPTAFVAANENGGGTTFDALTLKLLDDADTNVRREALRATQNLAVGDAVERRMLELSHDAKLGRDAIVLGLTTRPLVHLAIAQRLIEAIEDPASDGGLIDRCAWGLRVDVAPDARPIVDAALLRLLDESIDTNVRVNCVNALGRSPDLSVIETLATLAADASEVDRIRDAARRAANIGQ